jgi:HEAT repeat protein
MAISTWAKYSMFTTLITLGRDWGLLIAPFLAKIEDAVPQIIELLRDGDLEVRLAGANAIDKLAERRG